MRVKSIVTFLMLCSGGGRVVFGQVGWSHMMPAEADVTGGLGVPDPGLSYGVSITAVQSSHTWAYDGTTTVCPGDGALYAGGEFHAAPPRASETVSFPQHIAAWRPSGWSWLIEAPGTSNEAYLTSFGAMTVHNCSLYVAGDLYRDSTSTYGLHVWNSATSQWTTALVVTQGTIRAMCSAGGSIHYGGDMGEDGDAMTYAWDADPESEPIAHWLGFGYDNCRPKVVSMVNFESTEPASSVWLSVNGDGNQPVFPPCFPTELARAFYLDGNGDWQGEYIENEPTHYEDYGGLLGVDFTTSTPTLVFGYQDIFDFDPWDVESVACPFCDDPPVVLKRRWPDEAQWDPAASNDLRGVVYALGTARDAGTGLAFYVGGELFALDPADPNDNTEFVESGVFSSVNGANWTQPVSMQTYFSNTWSPGGAVKAIARHATACSNVEDLVVAGDFRGVMYDSRADELPELDPLPALRSSGVALYGNNRADFNFDGFPDGFDYDDFVECFENNNCPPGTSADFDCDGFADGFDYDTFVAWFEGIDNP